MNSNGIQKGRYWLLLALTPTLLLAQGQVSEKPPPADSYRGQNSAQQGWPKSRQRRSPGMSHVAGSGMISRLIKNDQLAQALDITESQRADLESVLASHTGQRETLRKQLHEAARSQAKLLTDSDVDENAIMAAVEKTGTIRTELAKLGMRDLLACRQILSAEQVSKIEAFRTRMKTKGPRKVQGPATAKSRQAEPHRRRRNDRDADREAPPMEQEDGQAPPRPTPEP